MGQGLVESNKGQAQASCLEDVLSKDSLVRRVVMTGTVVHVVDAERMK
jgi:hypothetical protein